MPLDHLPRPQWLTFDCYGTLIQWDEGLQAAVARILAANQGAQRAPTPARFLRIYDEHEHRLERTLNCPGNRGGCLVKVQRSSAQSQSWYG
ncbi:hypothetical protein QGN06_30235, partial [Achromobacter xylosoxidans]